MEYIGLFVLIMGGITLFALAITGLAALVERVAHYPASR